MRLHLSTSMLARNFVAFVLHVALIRSTSGTQANVENVGFKSYRAVLFFTLPNATQDENYTAAEYGSDSDTEEYSTNGDATDYTSEEATDYTSDSASEYASDYSQSETYSNKSRSSTKNSTSDSDNDSDSSSDLLTRLLTESYVGAVFLGMFLFIGALAVCWTFRSQKTTNSMGIGPDKGYSTFSNERDVRNKSKNSLDPTVLDLRPQMERGQAPARFLPDQALL